MRKNNLRKIIVYVTRLFLFLVFGEDFDQMFGQSFDQGLWEGEYSVRYYPA